MAVRISRRLTDGEQRRAFFRQELHELGELMQVDSGGILRRTSLIVMTVNDPGEKLWKRLTAVTCVTSSL